MASRVSWAHELSFSFYFALLVMAWETWTSPSTFLTRIIGYPLERCIFPVLAKWDVHLSPYGFLSRECLLWYILGLVLLLLLHLPALLPAMRTLLAYVAGVITIAGFPLFMLYRGNLRGMAAALDRWLGIEVILAVVCMFAYAYRGWPGNAILRVSLLVAHFGLWGWVSWNVLGIRFWLVFLLLGITTALVWGLYVREVRSGRPAFSKNPAS